jgi:ATP-binding cassette subfamily G (WHITE) protein 2 (PDR)
MTSNPVPGCCRGLRRKGTASQGDGYPGTNRHLSLRGSLFDIPVKGGNRRLLDHVDSWDKPETLTALMGVPG